jgi:hypothetical protein
MKRARFGSVLVAGWALSFAVAAAQSVQLADGRILLAEVDPTTVTGEGLRVKRLDNGGVLDLRWEHLSAASALEWKKKFDLAGDSQDEVTVRADEVEYAIAGGKQSLIGRIIENTPETMTLQAKGTPHRIKRTDIIAVHKVDAPVTQVLTKDEYYQELLAATPPGDDADKHLLLAETLMKVRNYERAREHVERAKELDNSKNKPQIEKLREKVTRFLESEKELKALEEITAARSRGGLADFEKGVKLIAQFQKDYPTTKLQGEFQTEKRRFDEARTRFLTGQVADKWRDAIRFVATKAVGGATSPLNLEAAREYAQNKMTDDIVARLVTQLRLDANEIKQLWGKRKEHPIGKRTEHFSYNVGSWVLGPEKILKDTDHGKQLDKQKGQKEAEQPANSPEMERFTKLLKEAMKRRQQAMQGQGEGQKEQSEEDWWAQAEPVERIGWLRAFYAEFGGQLVLTYAGVSTCINCFGEGTLAEIDSSGKMVRNKCFLCQGTKYLRHFKAY